jgi:hypothetical protein
MSISKTRWKIEPDRIIIRPFGLYILLGGGLAVIFIGLFAAYKAVNLSNEFSSVQFMAFMLVILGLFILSGFGYIVFDRNTNVMKQYLLGFIPFRTKSFDELEGVKVVNRTNGGYTYRMFTKADKFGKGIIISSGYASPRDKNAAAFEEQVIPKIDEFLGAAQPAGVREEAVIITDFKYFNYADGVYNMKVNRAGAFILGALLLAVGIHECTSAAWLSDMNMIGKLLLCGCFILGGGALMASAFTTTTFNPGTRTLERKNPVGLGNAKHEFDHFVTFRTVRKSYNGVHTGTEVQMHFQRPGEDKQRAIALSSFRNTRKIDRFVEEIRSIMK